MQELLEEVEAVLAQAGAAGSSGSNGSGGGAAPDEAGGAGGSVHAALLTDQAHAAYVAADGAERADLARQADAMLAAGVPELAAAAAAAGQAAAGPGGGPPVPALTSERAAGVLRSHWLLRLQLEWEAAVAEPFSLHTLALRRRQRRHV